MPSSVTKRLESAAEPMPDRADHPSAADARLGPDAARRKRSGRTSVAPMSVKRVGLLTLQAASVLAQHAPTGAHAKSIEASADTPAGPFDGESAQEALPLAPPDSMAALAVAIMVAVVMPPIGPWHEN